MVKRVFSDTDSCIHVWAQRNQDRGRNSTGSISFEGDTLVSYSTPIAKLVEHKGKIAALHGITKYSLTTSAQQSTAWQATSQYQRFHVLLLGANDSAGYAPSSKSNDWHKENLENYATRYVALIEKACRARSSFNIEFMKREASETREEAESYCKFFGLRFTPSRFPEPSAETLAKAKDKAKKRDAAQRKEREEREKKTRESMREQVKLFLGGGIRDLHYNWRSYHNEEEVKQVEERAATVWRTGIDVAGVALPAGLTLLRTRDNQVQTSQGAMFPVPHAKKAWPYVRNCKRKGINWHTNGHKIKLGSFGIEEISSAGDVRAGCHFVKYEEVEAMARSLGLL